jgi:hypothetical protein
MTLCQEKVESRFWGWQVQLPACRRLLSGQRKVTTNSNTLFNPLKYQGGLCFNTDRSVDRYTSLKFGLSSATNNNVSSFISKSMTRDHDKATTGYC